MKKLEYIFNIGGWALTLVGAGMGLFGEFLIENKEFVIGSYSTLSAGVGSFVVGAICESRNNYHQKNFGGDN